MKKNISAFILFLLIASVGYAQVKKILYDNSGPVTIIVSGSIYYEESTPANNDPLAGLVIWYLSDGEDGSASEAVILKGTTYYKTDPDTITFTSNSAQDSLFVFALGYYRTPNPPLIGSYIVNVNGLDYTVDTSNVIYFMDYYNITSISETDDKVPDKFSITQNFPNPFNPSTTIEYKISESSTATIKIYDSNGQLVRNLIDEYKYPGIYSTIWDGKNNSGNRVSSGTYFYHLKAGNFIQTKKMILLK